MLKRKIDIDGLCKMCIDDAVDKTLAISPLLWDRDDKLWYFIVGSGDENKRFWFDQIVVDGEADRGVILNRLTQCSLVLRIFDTQLDFAKGCEKLWPGECITGIRKIVEREHADGDIFWFETIHCSVLS